MAYIKKESKSKEPKENESKFNVRCFDRSGNLVDVDSEEVQQKIHNAVLQILNNSNIFKIK